MDNLGRKISLVPMISNTLIDLSNGKESSKNTDRHEQMIHFILMRNKQEIFAIMKRRKATNKEPRTF